MNPTTRALAWAALLGMLLGAALSCLLIPRTDRGCPVLGGASTPVVDTGLAVAVRESLASVAAMERRRADSLQAYLDTCPADTVARWFARYVPVTVRDTTRDTVHLPAPLARAVADSLNECHFRRDSLAGEVTLWKARDAAHAEAYRLAQERPVVVGDTSPPSRVAWATAGAAVATVGIATILFLAR